MNIFWCSSNKPSFGCKSATYKNERTQIRSIKAVTFPFKYMLTGERNYCVSEVTRSVPDGSG